MLLRKDNRAKPGNLPKKQCCFRNRGTLDRKVLSLFFRLQHVNFMPQFCVCAKVRNSIDKESAVFGAARPLRSFVTSGYRGASVFESEAAQEVCRWSWLCLSISLCIITIAAVKTDDYINISCGDGCENDPYAVSPTMNVPKS
jgi:hypothetical protein